MIVSKIVFSDEELQKDFDNLSENDPIKKGIRKAIIEIQNNPYCGRNVKKKLIPKKYNELNNLWIYNLPSSWRLIYSLAPNEIEILAVVLDWMDHKDYEHLFNF